MLTQRQADILRFIHQHTKAHGHAPTYIQIGAHLGLKSRGNICANIKSLVQNGYIDHLPKRKGMLRILKMPPGSDATNSGGYFGAMELRNWARLADDGLNSALAQLIRDAMKARGIAHA